MTIFIFFIVLLFIASMLIDSSGNQKKQKSKKEIEWIDKFKLSKEYEEEMHEWLEEWDGYNSQKGYKENVNKFILYKYRKINLALFIFWLQLLISLLGTKYTDLFQLLPIITNLLFLLSKLT